MSVVTVSPGRYIAANPRVVSRLLGGAGLRRRSTGAFDGFSVSGHRVEFSYRRGLYCREQEAKDMVTAETVLRFAGYLVVRVQATQYGTRLSLEVYQRVTNDDHAQAFLRRPWESKVVTDSGKVIGARTDPQVLLELSELERREKERQAAQEAAQERNRDGQKAIVDRLLSVGVAGAQISWRDEKVIEVPVEDIAQLLDRLLSPPPQRRES